MLIALFLTPLLSALVIFTLFTLSKTILKALAVVFSLIPLIILLLNTPQILGSTLNYNWLPELGVHFFLRVDSLSLVFLYLTAIIVPISLLAETQKLQYPNVFYGLILFLQGLMIGFFTAQDLVVFTFFWESMLLPLYFIITFWGKTQKVRAGFKFLIYMIAGSSLMVAAVLALYFTSIATLNNFDMAALAQTAETARYAPILFAIFLLAFAVKTPLFPFHAWLPDTYYQAPIAGTILLSALLSKAGIYGIIRIGLGLFPTLIQAWSPYLVTLAIAGVLYGGLAAWQQKDFKRLIAYSSFSHVNFILAGLFIWSQTAHTGAILQALNHGVTITALFLVAAWLEERLETTSINAASGLASYMPHLCWLTLFFVLSSVALPGTNNFVGELLVLYGLFTYTPWAAAALALTVILSVMYMLRWMQKMYFETPSPLQYSWIDLTTKEALIAIPLIALILWIGIYPNPVLHQIERPEKQSQYASLEEPK